MLRVGSAGSSRDSRDGKRNRRVYVRISDGVALSFVVHKVEELVFLDGPAKGAAKLFECHWLLLRGARRWRGAVIRVEVVARIKSGIAAIGVARAVKIVGTRFDSYVDDGAGPPAILCPGIFLGLELVNGIHGQDRPRIARGHNGIKYA